MFSQQSDSNGLCHFKQSEGKQGHGAIGILFDINITEYDILLNSLSAWKYENEKELRLISMITGSRAEASNTMGPWPKYVQFLTFTKFFLKNILFERGREHQRGEGQREKRTPT